MLLDRLGPLFAFATGILRRVTRRVGGDSHDDEDQNAAQGNRDSFHVRSIAPKESR